MKVYRYESRKSGRGPYRCGSPIEHEICGDHSDTKRHSHPTPYDSFYREEGRLERKFGWLCGCDSRRSLGTWFRGWKQRLLGHGFIVKEYDVPDDKVIGPDQFGQVVFWPTKEMR